MYSPEVPKMFPRTAPRRRFLRRFPMMRQLPRRRKMPLRIRPIPVLPVREHILETAGNLTASGTVPTAGRTVAMAGVPFGTKLLINGTVYTVEDLGTPYGHVDIYCGSHSEALSFGLQSADVYQVG